MTSCERLFYVSRSRIGLILMCLCGLALPWLVIARPVSASVSLIYFNAIPVVGQVRLEWATATELDCFGYYIQRSLSVNGAYERISPFIPCQGDPLSGWNYFWIDGAVVNGTTYWYRLEAIDTSNNSDFYGPESATPNTVIITPTATHTPNGSLTPTPTSTLSLTGSPTASATAAPTDALTPTATALIVIATPTRSGAYPGPASPTSPPVGVQVATPTSDIPIPTLPTPLPSATQPITATATLLPLPNITPEFPEGGIVLGGRETPTPIPAPAEDQPSAQSGWYPGGAILLATVLVLIWGLLGVWFYFSFRQLE